MTSNVVIAGVGMVPFRKPGDSKAYYEMGAEAAKLALADAGLDYGAVRQAYVGYVYGLTHQLRGSAGERQVDGARLALQHNLGLGGAAVVTLYEKH
jgi:hypothetical protein